MELSCEQVIREISDYIEADLDPRLRADITVHLKECNHCRAVYDGTRNVIRLVCDQRSFTLPSGFSQRLHAKLSADSAGDNS